MDSSRFHILCQDEFLGFEQNDENGENFLGKRKGEEKNEKESLLTSNEAKNAKYCIKNDSGMLSVYNATASEKYFDTGVYFEELPDEAKNKVTNGLYFFNETDLYDFLESYSS